MTNSAAALPAKAQDDSKQIVDDKHYSPPKSPCFNSYIDYISKGSYTPELIAESLYHVVAYATLDIYALKPLSVEFEEACLKLFNAENRIHFPEIHFHLCENMSCNRLSSEMLTHLSNQVWRQKVLTHFKAQNGNDPDEPGNDDLLHIMSQLLEVRIVFFTQQKDMIIYGSQYEQEIVLENFGSKIVFLRRNHPYKPSSDDTHKNITPIISRWTPPILVKKHCNKTAIHFENAAHDMQKNILSYLSIHEFRHTRLVSHYWLRITNDTKISQTVLHAQKREEFQILPPAAQNFMSAVLRKSPLIGNTVLNFSAYCKDHRTLLSPKKEVPNPDSKEMITSKINTAAPSPHPVPDTHYGLLLKIINGNTEAVFKQLNLNESALHIMDAFYMSPLFWSKLFPHESMQMVLAERSALLLPKDHPINEGDYFMLAFLELRKHKKSLLAETIAENITNVSQSAKPLSGTRRIPLTSALIDNMLILRRQRITSYSLCNTYDEPVAKTLDILLRRGAPDIQQAVPTEPTLFQLLEVEKANEMKKNSADTIAVLLRNGLDRKYFTDEKLQAFGAKCLKFAAQCKQEIIATLFNAYPMFCQKYISQETNGSSSLLHYAAKNKQINTFRFLLNIGCDPTLLDEDENTPIHTLCEIPFNTRSYNSWDVYQQYLSVIKDTIHAHPSLLKVKNKKGLTPFLQAASHCNYDILDLFEEKHFAEKTQKNKNILELIIIELETLILNDADIYREIPSTIAPTISLILSKKSFQELINQEFLINIFKSLIKMIIRSNTFVSVNFGNNVIDLIKSAEILIKQKMFAISYEKLKEIILTIPEEQREYFYTVMLKNYKISAEDHPKLVKLAHEEKYFNLLLELSEYYEKGLQVPKDMILAEGLANLGNSTSPRLKRIQTHVPDLKSLGDNIPFIEFEKLQAQRKSGLNLFSHAHTAAIDKSTKLLQPVADKKFDEAEKHELITSLIHQYTELKLNNANEKILTPLSKIILGLRWLPLPQVLTHTKSGPGPTVAAG